MSTSFKVGEWAEWTSEAQGSVKTKVGECIAVVPAYVLLLRAYKVDPDLYSTGTLDAFGQRNHESYIFATAKKPKGRKRQLYWPRVSGLKKVEVES